ncbi:MAG: BtpA/SgcQ family protein [Deltaproteobacteria bacterium]|nr:BtpA/SgcQ family protein [Deltaproteobacteria bacterium]
MFERCSTPSLVGVLHLLPLPGSPGPSPGLSEVIARAVADARALVDGGADACILENLGDAPFVASEVSPYVVAAMTRIAMAVREACPSLPMGINVLRNDALSALSIAAAVEAAFIRVNIHTGVMVTDQGVISGRARETLLLRNALGTSTPVAADVLVKHASPLGSVDLRQVARDTWYRGRAGALIVTGSGTGQPLNIDDLHTVREAVPEAPLWAGSGVVPTQAASLRPLLDAAIVGTWLHEDGDLLAPLSSARVAAMRLALR